MRYIILSIAILITLIWNYGVRVKASREQKTEKANELAGFLLTFSIAYVIWRQYSEFHLLWMLPVSFFLGMLSMVTPFRLLWPFSSLYFKLWYIGIHNKGRSYYLNEEYDKALTIFENEFKNGKQSAELFFNLGLTYGKLGEKGKEIDSYQESLKMDNKIKETHFNLANAYEDIGDFESAIYYMNNAIKIDSQYSKAHYSIALLYYKIEDNQNFIKHTEILNKLDPLFSKKLEDETRRIVDSLKN